MLDSVLSAAPVAKRAVPSPLNTSPSSAVTSACVEVIRVPCEATVLDNVVTAAPVAKRAEPLALNTSPSRAVISVWIATMVLPIAITVVSSVLSAAPVARREVPLALNTSASSAVTATSLAATRGSSKATHTRPEPWSMYAYTLLLSSLSYQRLNSAMVPVGAEACTKTDVEPDTRSAMAVWMLATFVFSVVSSLSIVLTELLRAVTDEFILTTEVSTDPILVTKLAPVYELTYPVYVSSRATKSTSSDKAVASCPCVIESVNVVSKNVTSGAVVASTPDTALNGPVAPRVLTFLAQ